MAVAGWMVEEDAPPVIRLARRDDLPAIIAILAADEVGGHGDTIDSSARSDYERAFAAIAADPNQALYVACMGERVVGTFQLTIQPTLLARGGTRALVEAVQVAPHMRSHGIGAAMMQMAIEKARARGAVQLALASSKRRTDAHRFYERLGFVRSHEGFKLKLR
jgi:GNAT superfamily N-acetyltransferase